MIDVQNLSRYFGSKKAVSEVSFNVSPGKVLGLLGPNGAGKSTCMKMITGCLKPDQGRVLLGDADVWKKPLEAKKHLGFLPESAACYEDLTVKEFLYYLASIHGLKRKERKSAVERVVERCFLEEVFPQSIHTLSKGYQHRVCLAQALVHDPSVIILDEPTDGLDPIQKNEVRALIDEIRSEKSIIISTHILEEAETVCSDVVIMNQGRLISSGTPMELKAQSPKERQLEVNYQAGDFYGKVSAALTEKFGSEFRVITHEEGSLLIELAEEHSGRREELSSELVSVLHQLGVSVERISYGSGTLDEVFRRAISEDSQAA